MSGQSFEHVLANINKLNRSLEGVIAVSRSNHWIGKGWERGLMYAGWQ